MEEDKDVLSEYDVEMLVKSDLVFNVEMSWLAFNWRVFAMAANEEVLIFERL